MYDWGGGVGTECLASCRRKWGMQRPAIPPSPSPCAVLGVLCRFRQFFRCCCVMVLHSSEIDSEWRSNRSPRTAVGFYCPMRSSVSLAQSREVLFLLRKSTIIPLLSSWGVRPALSSVEVAQPSEMPYRPTLAAA